MGLKLNRLWTRLSVSVFAVLLGTVASILLLPWDTIEELPDRWHFPHFNPEPASSLKSPVDIFEYGLEAAYGHHPINSLIREADDAHRLLLQRETQGLADAAQAYRRRRRRHPPPGFDEWVAFAEAHGCLMVEDFFDRIYHDLNPFWAIPPAKIRAYGTAIPHYIRVRNGTASRSEHEHVFMDSWFDLVQQIAIYLPDLDIPINHMDESRVLVPWKVVAKHMKAAKSSQARQNLDRAPSLNTFTAFEQAVGESEPIIFDSEGSYWNMARNTCPPETGTPKLDIDQDFSTPPVFPASHPFGTHVGFVQNWTVAQDFCYHPHLRNMHGTFVEPVSISTTLSLVPIFSGSKLLANNDILLPAPIYWSKNEDFAVSKRLVKWHNKRNEAFWRGTGSGGRNKVDNWTRFHRHRLVSMLNGTQVAMTLMAADGSDDGTHLELPHNFATPNQTLYPLISTKRGLLVDWIRSFTNVAFYWLECYPVAKEGCPYTGPWYRLGSRVPLRQMFVNKYLPDVDGNSFSGRFRAFLMSNSLPIKATIYTEWHDTRLLPWKHFVPMDNTFVDMWSIFEFLFQNDQKAEKIALEGRLWAERVLRKDDMLVYVYRLLLEYARLSDPNRENMGFGRDLERNV